MVKTFQECLSEFGSEYAIRGELAEGRLFRVGHGLYADVPNPGFLALAMKRHPKAVVCLDSAFFYQGLTDVVPDALHLATARSAVRIRDANVRQHFVPAKLLDVGRTTIVRNGTELRTYDLERLAIDAVRMRARLPYELYKEVVLSLRARSSDLYPAKIADYLEAFPRKDSVLDAIEKEIF